MSSGYSVNQRAVLANSATPAAEPAPTPMDSDDELPPEVLASIDGPKPPAEDVDDEAHAALRAALAGWLERQLPTIVDQLVREEVRRRAEASESD